MRSVARLLTLLVALLVALPPFAPVHAGGGGVAGVQMADMDRTADPRNDFYRYANGGWLDRTSIPADRSSYGADTEVSDRNIRILLDLLARQAARADLREGSDEWKAVRLYAQGTDLAARSAAGVEPIRGYVAEIDAITDLASLHRFLQGADFTPVRQLFSVGAEADLKDNGVYAAYLGGPGLGLPNRDYYTKEDADTKRVQAAYVATGAKLLGYLGYDAATAGRAAQSAFDFEHALAEPTLTREDAQDISLIYNPMKLTDLAARYPLMNWPAYLAQLGIGGTETVIVTESAYMEQLDGIVRRTDLGTIKEYLKLGLLWNTASYLSDEIGATGFEFSKVLGGQAERQPLQRRVLSQVNGSLGFAVGKLYVAENFPPEAKAQITELTDAVLAAFRARLERNPWMTPEAKAIALQKLANMRVKVGYPDVWRTYDAVQIGDSYVASLTNAGLAETRRQLARIGKPVDHDEWNTTPQTVNAFYNAIDNDITFPAGILQPPFFDYRADPASNFGSIGYVIGHEITHGFDLQGLQFDAAGNLNTWYTDRDRAEFGRLNKRVVDQYGAVEVLPGVRINGQITVTENVADLGGAQNAYDALQVYLREHSDPGLIDGLTQNQRYFVAAATSWRSKIRDEALRTQVGSDEHSPDEVRATLPLRNMDAFHAAFGTRPGDAMYLPPEERVVIW